MRINLHPRSDLAAEVQHDLVAFLETGFYLHDISIVYADLDVPKLYHILSVNDRHLGFRAEQQCSRRNLDADGILKRKADLHIQPRHQAGVGIRYIDLRS
jgi:hypothetical protein